MPSKALLLLFSLVSLGFNSSALAGDGDSWLELSAVASDSLLTRQRYSGGIFFSTEESHYYFRGGLSTLVAFDNNSNNDYYGIEGSAGLKLGGPISFLIGAGILLGKTDTCEFSLNNSQTSNNNFDIYTDQQCTERNVAGLLPEIGIRITLGDSVFVSAFARKYILSDGEDNFFGRGISLGFSY